MQEFLKKVVGTDDRLALKLRGGNVHRYHTEGRSFNQNTAEHMWRATMILLHFWPWSSIALILWVLQHDVAEGVFGDVPAPVKRIPEVSNPLEEKERELEQYLKIPDSRELSFVERARAKIVDYVELCITCSEIPGSSARNIFLNGMRYVVAENVPLLPKEEQGMITSFMDELYQVRVRTDGGLL